MDLELHRGPKTCPRRCGDSHSRLAFLIFSRKLCPFCEESHLNPSSWRARHRKLGEIGCISGLTFFFSEKGWTQDLRVGLRLERPSHFILFFFQWGKNPSLSQIKTKMLIPSFPFFNLKKETQWTAGLQRKLLIPLKENDFSTEANVLKQMRGRVPLGCWLDKQFKPQMNHLPSNKTNIVSSYAVSALTCGCVCLCVWLLVCVCVCVQKCFSPKGNWVLKRTCKKYVESITSAWQKVQGEKKKAYNNIHLVPGTRWGEWGRQLEQVKPTGKTVGVKEGRFYHWPQPTIDAISRNPVQVSAMGLKLCPPATGSQVPSGSGLRGEI